MQQKEGSSTCLASVLIEQLPEAGMPLREEERQIAQNVSAVTYVGKSHITTLIIFYLLLTRPISRSRHGEAYSPYQLTLLKAHYSVTIPRPYQQYSVSS